MSEYSQYNASDEPAPSGFSFENIHRNRFLEEATSKALNSKSDNASSITGATHMLPKFKKTGTTICACIFKNGVVLAADTRSTNGEVVAEKNCEKIHYLTDNIRCCGAGTAADTAKTTELISSQLTLLQMNTKTKSRLVTACTLLKRLLFRYQGNIGAALIVGGCDLKGPQVYHIYPHGSTSKQPFTSMGSGCVAAMSVLETGWTDNMEEADAIALIKRAILSGVFNDLGSGSNCDYWVGRMDGTEEFVRNAVTPNDVSVLRDQVRRSGRLTIAKGSTKVLSSKFVQAKKNDFTLADLEIVPMET